VIAIGPDVDAGDWIDIAAIGDADRTVAPYAFARMPKAVGPSAWILPLFSMVTGLPPAESNGNNAKGSPGVCWRTESTADRGEIAFIHDTDGAVVGIGARDNCDR